MVEFLNTTFASFDRGVATFMHNLAVNGHDVLTPLFKTITFLGEKGLLVAIICVILFLFKKTRLIGLHSGISILISVLFTKVILKDLISRPRPYLTSPYDEYRLYIFGIGDKGEDSFSFPSGHLTTISAFMVGWMISGKKNIKWIGIMFIILMGMSRIYLVAHYTTDVIGGILTGTIASLIALPITVYFRYHSNRFKKCLISRILNDFSIMLLFKNKNQPEKE